jgi:hypothetical protein
MLEVVGGVKNKVAAVTNTTKTAIIRSRSIAAFCFHIMVLLQYVSLF